MPIKLIKLGNLLFKLSKFLLEFYSRINFWLFYNESNTNFTTKNISIPKLTSNYFALW
jgi:hypothetical protein